MARSNIEKSLRERVILLRASFPERVGTLSCTARGFRPHCFSARSYRTGILQVVDVYGQKRKSDGPLLLVVNKFVSCHGPARGEEGPGQEPAPCPVACAFTFLYSFYHVLTLQLVYQQSLWEKVVLLASDPWAAPKRLPSYHCS
jgi:hypothetical protein